jgi:hypothetical protein
MDRRLVCLSSSPELNAPLRSPGPYASVRGAGAKYPDELASPLLEPLDECRVVGIDTEELLAVT